MVAVGPPSLYGGLAWRRFVFVGVECRRTAGDRRKADRSVDVEGRVVVFIDEVPKTSVGKIAKKVLRKQYAG